MIILDLVNIVSLVISALNGYMLLVLRANNAELRDSIRSEMRENEDRLRGWINGSFMRVREIEVHLKEIHTQLEKLEKNK